MLPEPLSTCAACTALELQASLPCCTPWGWFSPLTVQQEGPPAQEREREEETPAGDVDGEKAARSVSAASCLLGELFGTLRPLDTHTAWFGYTHSALVCVCSCVCIRMPQRKKLRQQRDEEERKRAEEAANEEGKEEGTGGEEETKTDTGDINAVRLTRQQSHHTLIPPLPYAPRTPQCTPSLSLSGVCGFDTAPVTKLACPCACWCAPFPSRARRSPKTEREQPLGTTLGSNKTSSTWVPTIRPKTFHRHRILPIPIRLLLAPPMIQLKGNAAACLQNAYCFQRHRTCAAALPAWPKHAAVCVCMCGGEKMRRFPKGAARVLTFDTPPPCAPLRYTAQHDPTIAPSRCRCCWCKWFSRRALTFSCAYVSCVPLCALRCGPLFLLSSHCSPA